VIRKSYAALRNLVTLLLNPNPNSDPDPIPDPNPEKTARIRITGKNATKDD
jgi:hypothetical protein